MVTLEILIAVSSDGNCTDADGSLCADVNIGMQVLALGYSC